MAWRIEDSIVRGEIDNRVHGRVEGKIWLADRSEPLVLSLTGNCHKDLAGCKITFTNPRPKSESNGTLSTKQAGLVGDITAARKVRVFEWSDYPATEEGKSLPKQMANCLYVEWFSQTNGRIVIESAHYQITVSEPHWQLSAEEEVEQHEANRRAMREFVDRIAGAVDPKAEAAYEGSPKDEFEWELFLRAADRRTTKFGEWMEKYMDNPDRNRIVAQEMGWTEIGEVLDAEEDAAPEEEAAVEDLEAAVLEEPDVEELVERPLRHPLVERLIERSAELFRLTENEQDKDVRALEGYFTSVGPKIAGALSVVNTDRVFADEMKGLAIAKLKRALGELSQALNAADRLKTKSATLSFPLGDWITEMLTIRQEILALMDELRG
jgi:hypothetical protein